MSNDEFAEIGKYRILGQIGEGAMGVVYRATDLVLNRPVAIKVMNDSVARDTELRARFLREAQSAGSLQHPNVVTIYDFGEVNGHLFIAMELVEGTDLIQLLLEKRPLSVVQKIDVLIDVLNGLAYAHKRGIVHRDVKPANIRIDDEGRARIMDFGIAHLASSTMTRTGTTVGTPSYMSPEQIAGGAITASSDIFSAGAVMYELFTGVQAFHGASLQNVMYQIISAPAPAFALDDPALAPDQRASLSASLGEIVDRALAKEPAARFASALDMAAALSAVRARVLVGHEAVGPASLRATVATALATTQAHAASSARRRRAGIITLGMAALAMASFVTVKLIGRSTDALSDSLAIAPESTARSAAPVPAGQAAPPPAPLTAEASSRPSSAPPADPRSPASPATRPVDANADSRSSGAAHTPTRKEVDLFNALKTTALDARARAIAAGATPRQLDSGEAHNRIANTLFLEGKVAEAGNHLNQAASWWSDAERRVRAAAAIAAESTTLRSTPVPAASPVVPPVRRESVTVPVAEPPVPPAEPPAVGVAAAIAAYARAIESRDVEVVRRAFPGLTSREETGWKQFFASVQSLRVTFATSGLEVDGSTAEAKVAGQYDFVNNSGKADRRPVSFTVSLRRQGTSWFITAVH